MVTIGNSALPTPDAVHVEPAGILSTIKFKSLAVPEIPPFTPITKSKCIGDFIMPFLFRRIAISTIPLSNTSTSGLIPSSFILFANSIIVFSVFTNISSPPKLQVPQSSVAISGRSRVGESLSSLLIPTAPPVEG